MSLNVNNWYENWNPPTNLYADSGFALFQEHIIPTHMRNFSHNNNSQRKQDYKPPNFLPFLLQLGLLDSKANRKTPPNDEDSSKIIEETTGPFRTLYQWKMLDFAYPTEEEREMAINTGNYIQENNLPLGVETYKDRLFLTMPKWKPGVPATLAVLPKHPVEKSPKLVPYPDWDYHLTESCEGLTSVFRVQADTCGRLWILDSGQIEVTIKPKQVCPPEILIFDLSTDRLYHRFKLPEEFIKEDSLYSNIVVDIRDGDCDDVHAYLADVWRFGLVVYSLRRNKSWRITDHLFYPDPLSAAYNVHGLEFEWTDGIFGLALSPYNKKAQDRLLYFHPMSSFREFYVKTSIICNESHWSDAKDGFRVMGESRGSSGHASASGMDRNGVMFYNLVTRDTIGCWDSRKPYKRTNQGVVASDPHTLVFPNDLKIDNEDRQSVWILTNRLPFYLYRGLDADQVNFRIMSAFVDEAVENTICDPRVAFYDTFLPVEDGHDCY